MSNYISFLNNLLLAGALSLGQNANFSTDLNYASRMAATSQSANFNSTYANEARQESAGQYNPEYARTLLSWLDRAEHQTGVKASDDCRRTIASGRYTDSELFMYSQGVRTALNNNAAATDHKVDDKDKPQYWITEEESDGSTRIRNAYGHETFWLDRNGKSFNIGVTHAKLIEQFGGRGLMSGIYQMIAPDNSYAHDIKKAA